MFFLCLSTWAKGGEITLLVADGLFFSRETLEREQQAKKVLHPATFGPKKYHLRECMCEIEGQVPCPGRVPLPKEMTGKYKTAMKAAAASK